MSLRKLPEFRAPSRPNAVSFDLSDRAVQAWAGGAAPEMAADENVISVLEPIGLDWWTGEGFTAKRASAALRSIGNKPVTVVINSPGGDFFEGVTIYNLLRAHPQKVTVKIVGIAASAASVIAMAGDDIQVAKFGFMMIHNTQWVAVGDRHTMAETADIMETFDRAANEMYAERTGRALAQIEAMMDAETWLAGQDVVDAGFADGLLSLEKAEAGDKPKNEAPALYRIEAALAAGRSLPRSERRRLIKEVVDGMPGAAGDPATPCAGETGGEDSAAQLNLAIGRLRLATAAL